MFDLKGFRKDRRMSQKQLSEVLGIGTSFISQIETGKDPMPSYIPEKLAAAFGEEEVKVYHREPSYAADAERMFHKRYMFQGGRPAYRRAFMEDAGMAEVAAMDDLMGGRKVDYDWIDRVIRALERRDELAMQQQREYERQGARLDELLSYLKSLA